MTRVGRDLYAKKLREMLEVADDEAFFTMLWATDAMKSGREKLAAQWFQFSDEAAVVEAERPLAVQKWELETLASQLFATPKGSYVRGAKNRSLNCRAGWSAF